jgi:hypothetical protein
VVAGFRADLSDAKCVMFSLLVSAFVKKVQVLR